MPRLFDIPLYLPSVVVGKATCDVRLLEYEWTLGEALALDALSNLQKHLLCRSHLWYDCIKNNCGQCKETHSWVTLDALKQSIEADTACYLSAHGALTVLNRPLAKGQLWQSMYYLLLDGNIKGLMVDGNEGTEETLVTTWIWKVPGISCDSSAKLQEGIMCTY